MPQASKTSRANCNIAIKSAGNVTTAVVLADTGYALDLMVSEYKAQQLGLKPDGWELTVTAAKGTKHRARRQVHPCMARRSPALLCT